MEVDALIKTGHGEQTSEERYHAPLTVGYRHPGRLLHGSNIVAFNNPRLLVKGVPVVNLRPEKIFRIGVFFDGTGNNDKNDAYKERRGSKSRTNVARLFAAYPQVPGESAKIYVSGVGTTDIEDESLRAAMIDAGEDESDPAQAFGVDSANIKGTEGISFLLSYLDGQNGAFYKWQSLLEQLKRTIVVLEDEYDRITHIVFDVMGFSRGAALSRHFVNALYKGLPDYTRPVDKVPNIGIRPHLLGDEKPDKFPSVITCRGYEPDKSRGVSVRFLGLFDTVASFYKAGNSDEGNFQMGLEPTCATTVFQLAATHEYRVNFPRTSLEKAGWKPDNFFEEHFPGAHSDVGGGYPSYKQYDKTGLPERLGFPIESTYNRELIKKELCGDFSDSSYLARKQLNPDDIPAERKRWQQYCFQRYRQHGEVKLKGSRLYYYRLQPVSNAIAGLSLERMKQQGQAAGIEWREEDYITNLTPDYAENTACQALWVKLSTLPAGGITQASWEKELEPEQYRLVHRSHDTALSPGYDTFMERSINDVTRDAQGNPERRIWDNE
ncbi:T6SS phospholipase effector Tle1-like catalytic domain-containing protein [Vibrio neptunius]|nr:DUF2235 domain-containing protein [Vibrio neptunius]